MLPELEFSKARLRRLTAVQASPLLMLGRFAIIAAFDLYTGSDFRLLKTYAVVNGLVSPFTAAASLRARVVLLGQDSRPEDFGPMRVLLVLSSLLGLVGAAVILWRTEYVALGLLVAGSKLTENVMDAFIGQFQASGQRDQGITLQVRRKLSVLARERLVDYL